MLRKKILLSAVIILLFNPVITLSQQEDPQKILKELKDLMKVPETREFKILEEKFLNKIRQKDLSESLKFMMASNPPKLIVSDAFLPEYIADSYTLYVPSEDSEAVEYLLGHYIVHILYGKDRYKDLASHLLIKQNFNTLIRLKNPLWFFPPDNNQLSGLIPFMDEKGTWLVDLARFFGMVMRDERFEEPLWIQAGGKNTGDIDERWKRYIPEKTEGYPLTVLNDIYDHEMFRDGIYYPDDDPINIVNGLDVIISILMIKEINDFTDFQIYFGEVVSNLDPLLQEVIAANNWQVIFQRKAEEVMLKNFSFPKVIVHPQPEPITEFDKLQALCTAYEKVIVDENKESIVQFTNPLDYVPSSESCMGAYILVEVIKDKDGGSKARIKEGPIPVQLNIESIKMHFGWIKEDTKKSKAKDSSKKDN